MSKSPEKKSGKVNYVWVLVGGYLVYLGAQLLFGIPKSETPVVVDLIAGLAFVVIGGLLLLREWKSYKYGLDHIDDPETWSDDDGEEDALPEMAEQDGEDEA